MAEKKVTVRFSAEGGRLVKSELEGLGVAGTQAFEKINRAQKSAETSADVFTRAIDDEQRAFNALRAAVDPAFAAIQRYERAVEAAQRAVQRGVTSQEQANRVLAQVRAQNLAGAEATQRSALGFRNLGLQLNQVAQQGLVTGNYLGALAIQLPDMLLGFGGLGIAIGTAAALLTPFALGLMESSDNAEDAGKALDTFTGNLKEYQSFVDRATADTKDLREEFGRFAEEMRTHAAFMAQVNLSQAMGGLDDALGTIREELDAAMNDIVEMGRAAETLMTAESQQNAGIATAEQVLNFREAYEQIRDEAMASADAIGLTIDQTNQLNKALNNIGKAEGMAELRDAASAALSEIEGMFPPTTKLPPEVGAIAEKLHEVVEAATLGVIAAEDLEDPLTNAKDAAFTLSGVDMAGAINAAIGPASLLAGELRAAAAAAQLINAQSGRYDPTTGLPYPDSTGLTFGLPGVDPYGGGLGGETPLGFGDLNAPPRRYAPDPPPKSPSGGGGGGGASAEDRALRDAEQAHKRLNEALEKAAETYPLIEKQTRDYARALADLDKQLDDGTITYEDYVDGVDRLTEKLKEAEAAQRELSGLVDSGNDTIIDSLMGQADAAEAFGNALKRAALQYLIFGEGPLSGLFGGNFGGLLGGLFKSFDGGGYTGDTPRSGGLDGKGGFLAMLHPRETVTDHTKSGGNGVRQSLHVTVGVDTDSQGNITPYVERVSQRNAAYAAGAAVDVQRQGFGGQVSEYQDRRA